MNYAILFRDKTGDQGTEGILSLPLAGFSCYTIELPWRDNERQYSCIPQGLYEVELRFSRRFGLSYWIKDVPDRDWILMHSGNWAGDSRQGLKTHSYGCILPGKKRGLLAGQRAVLSSRMANKDIRRFLNDKPFKLQILGVT